MSVYAGPEISNNGLVLSLDSSNTTSYPGTGSTWYDISGYNNHCVFNVTPTYSNGTFTFNGTSHYGTITNSSSLNFSDQQTIIFAFKPTATTGRRNPWNQSYGGYGTWTDECASSAINYFYGDAGTNNTPYTGHTSTTDITRNTWHILAATRNTTYSAWYKNATLLSTVAHAYGSLTTDSNNILIGYGYAGFWEGDMQMILAYTRDLTIQEIKQNFIAIRGRYGI
jgi:hypothetical protein